ncbi:hypothetical protein WJX81_006449 [Elliptochloris bilobata]|uniref:Uncharacterized protein n=1 Tax=Elliptochloris bilobata TaxID=381761 RepID=A0AAW1RDM1_9CHLO
MEDPLTADFPRRNADEEEEREKAQEWNEHPLAPPVLQWCNEATAPATAQQPVSVLVLAVGAAACVLVRQCCEYEQSRACGELILPEPDTAADGADAPPRRAPEPCSLESFIYRHTLFPVERVAKKEQA